MPRRRSWTGPWASVWSKEPVCETPYGQFGIPCYGRLVRELAFTVERDSSKRPLFLQIARTVVDDICRGRLKPGDRLPGTRTLARSLGVNRVTVLTAYDELSAEGWITVRPASGARVSDELPDADVRQKRAAGPRLNAPAAAGYDLSPAPVADRALDDL